MGKDWVSDLLKRRTQKLRDHERQMQLSALAQSQAPDMFRRLCAQVQQDVSLYTQGTGNVLRCVFGNETCEVKYEKFPTFWMQISLANSGFPVIRTSKKSSSAEQSREDFAARQK